LRFRTGRRKREREEGGRKLGGIQRERKEKETNNPK